MSNITSAELPVSVGGPDIIPLGIKLSWSLGALGVAFMMNTVAFLALFYMVSVLKIEPAIASLVIFLPKLFDAVTDPIVGTWSDRISTGKSRRRPFLFGGAVLSALSFLMIFTTPMFDSEWLRVAYIFTGLILFALGYTIFNIPYLSMPAEMTEDYHERSSIHGYRVIFVSIGGLLAGSGVPLLLEQMGRSSWTAYAVVGVIGAGVILTSMLLAWYGTAKAKFTTSQIERPHLMKELTHVFSNKHFIRLLLVKFCQLFGVAATIAAFPFFVVNVMQHSFNMLALYGVVVAGCGIIAAPLLVHLSKKIGKSKTYIVSAVFFLIAVGSWTFVQPNEPTHWILLRGALLGVASTGNVIMAMSMLTDIANYDAKITGVRREGVFTSFYTFVEKFTFAFGPLVVGIALSVAGFNEALPLEDMQTPQIRHALLLGMSYIPATMGLVSIFLLMGYKLKESDLSD